MRIMIVEDEAELRTPLVKRLEIEGFEVDGARSALEFYRGLAGRAYDIAVIDTGLPDESGLSLVSWLRDRGGMGIILLTDDAHDRITGFRNGADLNLTKPVDGDELVQAVQSLGRRIVLGEAPRAEPTTSQWFFDPVHWRLQAPEGQAVKLTAVEVKFITRLFLQPGGVIARREFRAELGYSHDKAGDRNLDALVRRLRRKIEDMTGRPAPIQTVHGQGFVFSAPLRMERRAGARSITSADYEV